MKKFAVLMLLISVVTAQASLKIYVKWDEGPYGSMYIDYPDSKLTINPSDVITIGIMDILGQTQPGALALGISMGPGSLDASGMKPLAGVSAALTNDPDSAAQYGLLSPYVALEIGPNMTGMLIRDLLFHCDGPGDVTIVLVDENGMIVDSQVIHQPEPMTLGLLGLGGLSLVMSRKRRAA
ncbi:MAG TPA: PEP-CTERM sorting domain-containing protein [Anaerohalosphaeraceae bacterium]|nr:PEP-CTERM sorting domain-containing protein [Anaerohalosphaeraceae bacterium]HOL30780.1 PEP-CTERM sorting domain-containing protein [Anaerohalosphaeraceae bacterium]HOM76646.1 PEP-CTERM sorting domain-containing protein [Anaerohalosphaeraceae bacterium]HPC63709.1 PEP-CTERM sorting domain-containing protein [Anaerohalosphaeraceae bacterium]HPO69810.1 PEP-CTERM sorting domain-containing protein [Anaerohalosphaeraceae bacterium]